jgi:hypothetical protein
VIGRALFGDDIDDVIPELQSLAPVLGDLAIARAMQVVRLPLNWPTPQSRCTCWAGIPTCRTGSWPRATAATGNSYGRRCWKACG